MTILAELTTSQLNAILAIREQIEALQRQIALIADGGAEISTPFALKLPQKRRRMSRAGRGAIAAGARARWANLKGKAKATPKAIKKDRRSSPAVRAKLAAAAKA